MLASVVALSTATSTISSRQQWRVFYGLTQGTNKPVHPTRLQALMALLKHHVVHVRGWLEESCTSAKTSLIRTSAGA